MAHGKKSNPRLIALEGEISEMHAFMKQHFEWMKNEYGEQMAFMPVSMGHCEEHAELLCKFVLARWIDSGGNLAFTKRMLSRHLYAYVNGRAINNQKAWQAVKPQQADVSTNQLSSSTKSCLFTRLYSWLRYLNQ